MLSSAGEYISIAVPGASLRMRPTFNELAAVHRTRGDLYSDSMALHIISVYPCHLEHPRVLTVASLSSLMGTPIVEVMAASCLCPDPWDCDATGCDSASQRVD